MNIIIFGYTGMLGSALIDHLKDKHTITGISRKRHPNEFIENHTWDNLPDILKKNNFDVAINLCGETIGQPWTKWSKDKIYDSRINTTNRIVNALTPYNIHFISASGVGIYDSFYTLNNKTVNEDTILNDQEGFLQNLAFQWEEAAKSNTQTTILRTAVVMKKNDGVQAKMLLGKQIGIISQFGMGENPFPWISIEDWCRALDFIIDQKIVGPINLTSPELSSYNDVMNVLAQKAQSKKITIPNLIVKCLLGEMGESLFLKGSPVLPKKLMDLGFQFEHDSIKSIET